MDPKKIHVDDRLTDHCVYCWAKPESRDHVPSKVFLDEPYPDDLPVVPACISCNNSFSLDEQYVACLVECMKSGSVDPSEQRREKIARILRDNPALKETLARQREPVGEKSLWQPDIARIDNVVLKLAQGHIVYELSDSMDGDPGHLGFDLLTHMSDEARLAFETVPVNVTWPEVGCRMSQNVVISDNSGWLLDGWRIVQENRYRYLVSWSDRMTARFVIGEFLACQVMW